MSQLWRPTLADRVVLTALSIEGYSSGFVNTSVGDLHVLDAPGHGDLPPTVLLHGLSAAGIYYGPLLRRLRPRVRRLIAPDLPGHGFSPVPENGLDANVLRSGLFEVLDAVIEEPAVLFGNSMGGLSAVLYALERPEKVRGLVLCSPGGAQMSQQEFDGLLNRFRVDTHTEALQFVDRLLTKPGWRRPFLAYGVRQKLAHPIMRTLVDQASLADMLTPEQLAGLQIPVSLIWGKNERILPASGFDFFSQHLPAHAQIEQPDQFGHSPYIEYPNAVSRRILDFLIDVHQEPSGTLQAADSSPQGTTEDVGVG